MRRDYMDYNDYRNSYDSRDRYADNRDYHMYPGGQGFNPNSDYRGYPDRRDYRRDYMDYNDYNRSYHGYYGETPFEVMQSRNYPMDFRYDYAQHNSLRREDTEKWIMKLMKHIDEKDKEMLSKEKIMRKAEELGVRFDEFKPEEFYITVLMMYTDFGKILGNANIDIYVRLAKAWLNDEDASKQNSEKLSAYYNNIINGR